MALTELTGLVAVRTRISGAPRAAPDHGQIDVRGDRLPKPAILHIFDDGDNLEGAVPRRIREVRGGAQLDLSYPGGLSPRGSR